MVALTPVGQIGRFETKSKERDNLVCGEVGTVLQGYVLSEASEGYAAGQVHGDIGKQGYYIKGDEDVIWMEGLGLDETGKVGRVSNSGGSVSYQWGEQGHQVFRQLVRWGVDKECNWAEGDIRFVDLG